MRKIIALVLALMLVVTCFAACGDNGTSSTSSDASTSSAASGDESSEASDTESSEAESSEGEETSSGDVSELNIGQVQEGQEVEITAEALPGQTFIGRVDQVSINGTTTNGFTTYPVTILLEEYGDLNPGMNVSTSIIVERAEGALTVPVSAVNSDGTVLVPGEGAMSPDGATVADPSRLERRQVTLGRSDQDYVEITSGLEEGDTVLVPLQSPGAMGGMTAVAGG